jgi:hypothetical protein
MQGETLSQIAKSNGVSVKDIMDANPDITDPNKISAGQEIQIPHETGNPVYDKGVGAGGPGSNKIDPTDLKNQDAVNGVVKGDVTLPDGTVLRPKMAPNVQESIIDEALTVRMWALNESRGRHGRRPIYVTESGRKLIFKMIARQYQLDEGALDKLKGFNKKASAAIGRFTEPYKQRASSFTNKITYNDLERGWERTAKLDKEDSVDSEQVRKFLNSRGVKDPLINSVFKQLNIPFATTANAADNTQQTSDTPSINTQQTPGTLAAPTSPTAGAADAMGLDSRFGDALRARAGTSVRTKQAPADTQTVAVPGTTPAVAKAKTQTQTQTVPTPAKTATTQIPTTPAANPVTKTTTMTVPASKATTPAPATQAPVTQPSANYSVGQVAAGQPSKVSYTGMLAKKPLPQATPAQGAYSVKNPYAATPVPAAKTTTTANAGKFASRGIPGLDAQQAAYQKSLEQVPVEESIDLAEALWRKMKSKQ